MYRRLMVPLDEMVDCQNAIPVALSIGRKTKAVVELVHISIPPSMAQLATPGVEFAGTAVGVEADADYRAQAQRDLTALVAKAGDTGSTKIESVMLDRADVARAIEEYAEQSQPDLVIMTAHDHSRLERLILGSVSESVVRHVAVPTIVVPSSPGRSVEDDIQIAHILVPLDGSALGAAITPHAVRLAQAMGARVTLLSVAEEGMVPPPPGLAAFDAALSPSVPEATNFLDLAAEEFRNAGVSTETKIVIGRDRSRTIMEFADDNGVDLIAMSTHGRRGIGRLVAGSVASKVLREAKVPVMSFRPEDLREKS